MWTAAGAITSAIALSETFNALSQGVVEMQENPYDMIKGTDHSGDPSSVPEVPRGGQDPA